MWTYKLRYSFYFNIIEEFFGNGDNWQFHKSVWGIKKYRAIMKDCVETYCAGGEL